MTIFLNTVKRIFRNKIQLFFIVIFPVAFMMLGYIEEKPVIKAVVFDHDQTALTETLKRHVMDDASIVPFEEDEIERKLMSLEVDYVLVIDKGFTNRLIAGEEGGITAYTVQESNFSEPVGTFLEQWLQHARTIADAVNNDEEAFYEPFMRYDQQGLFQIEQHSVVNEGVARSLSVFGYFIIAMLYTSLIAGLYILLNKSNFTFHRTLTAPISIRGYMLQTIVGFLFVSIVQITFVMLMLKWVFGIYMAGSAIGIYLLFILFSLVTVSFGVAVSSISQNMIQACLIGICLISPLAVLGGAYFPLDFAPDIFITFSYFTPVSWVLKGTEKLLLGATLADLGKEGIVLLLFATIFFLIGIMRKADIAK
ncbi:ABC transporter permease [Paenibacillus sp. NPDC058071]|uniref:ABC transporter permease n=1 Tax=Paenibacillus sp. NPDC058071 TaxID=3346326 RepID=UPI0036D8886D